MQGLIWINPQDPLPDSLHALTAEDGANGLLAAGNDLNADRLTEAYQRGIFPWFSSGEPVLWWTPNPRMVLRLAEFKISKSFRKAIGKALADPTSTLTVNQDFVGVMQACAAPRGGQSGTWISEPMIQAYAELNARGLAHSLEWRVNGRLVGGLYCVAIGKMVFGESMFSRQPEASKLALAGLVAWLLDHGGQVIDCQQQTAHLASLGAKELNRADFEQLVQQLTRQTPLPWAAMPPQKNALQRFCTLSLTHHVES
jgi:leucyl/phenylalanyl-tRNA---protein transferase